MVSAGEKGHTPAGESGRGRCYNSGRESPPPSLPNTPLSLNQRPAPLVNRVEIVEVAPRDGLQNEDRLLATDDKVELIRRVVAAGSRRVEVASFAHPKLVPQMGDAEAVCARLEQADASYIGLVLNRRGLERALSTAVDEVNFSVSATDAFGQRNQGADVDTALAALQEMVPAAKEAGRSTTATISVVFGCPYQGEVRIGSVAAVAARCVRAGVDELALGDTIGVATPRDTRNVIAAVKDVAGDIPLRCHFHDTRNTAVANAFTAYELGVDRLDASVGGIGGCPYAPQATGNVGTDDLVYAFERMGIRTGLDLESLITTAHWISAKLDKTPPSMVAKAGPFPA